MTALVAGQDSVRIDNRTAADQIIGTLIIRPDTIRIIFVAITDHFGERRRRYSLQRRYWLLTFCSLRQ